MVRRASLFFPEVGRGGSRSAAFDTLSADFFPPIANSFLCKENEFSSSFLLASFFLFRFPYGRESIFHISLGRLKSHLLFFPPIGGAAGPLLSLASKSRENTSLSRLPRDRDVTRGAPNINVFSF